jgi:hypothetical protein
LRPARTTFTAIVLTAAAAGAAGAIASPAAAQTILVTPGSPHPGQKIHISVPGCSTGPTPHTAESAAFTRTVTLYGKADTGDADPTIKKELKPGTYPISADCGAGHVVRGQVVVAAMGTKGGEQSEKPPVIIPNTPTGAPATTPAASISASPAASSSNSGSSTSYWVLGAAVIILGGGAGVFLLRRRGGARH